MACTPTIVDTTNAPIPPTAATTPPAQAAIFLDAKTLQGTFCFAPAGSIQAHGFDPASRFAHVSRTLEVSQSAWRTALYVLDVRTGEELARREFDGGGIELIWAAD